MGLFATINKMPRPRFKISSTRYNNVTTTLQRYHGNVILQQLSNQYDAEIPININHFVHAIKQSNNLQNQNKENQQFHFHLFQQP